jgi:hypothetical protein
VLKTITVCGTQGVVTLDTSSSTMMPSVRTPNQCCINNAIEQLSFDPTLQDLTWKKAQARPKPYEVEMCSRRDQNGETICDFAVSEVLHALGVGIDPLSRTDATVQKATIHNEQAAGTGEHGLYSHVYSH